ncbi:hypothetical protein HNY73_011708, partial [Argiope bruennichi]
MDSTLRLRVLCSRACSPWGNAGSPLWGKPWDARGRAGPWAPAQAFSSIAAIVTLCGWPALYCGRPISGCALGTRPQRRTASLAGFKEVSYYYHSRDALRGLSKTVPRRDHPVRGGGCLRDGPPNVGGSVAFQADEGGTAAWFSGGGGPVGVPTQGCRSHWARGWIPVFSSHGVRQPPAPGLANGTPKNKYTPGQKGSVGPPAPRGPIGGFTGGGGSSPPPAPLDGLVCDERFLLFSTTHKKPTWGREKEEKKRFAPTHQIQGL